MFNRFVLKSSYWRRVLFVALVTLSTNANAHPHSWIGNQLTVNGKGTLVDSISMEWVFDPFTSAYALDGDFSVFDSEETAHKEAVRLMSNLLNTHYFTWLFSALLSHNAILMTSTILTNNPFLVSMDESYFDPVTFSAFTYSGAGNPVD